MKKSIFLICSVFFSYFLLAQELRTDFSLSAGPSFSFQNESATHFNAFDPGIGIRGDIALQKGVFAIALSANISSYSSLNTTDYPGYFSKDIYEFILSPTKVNFGTNTTVRLFPGTIGRLEPYIGFGAGIGVFLYSETVLNTGIPGDLIIESYPDVQQIYFSYAASLGARLKLNENYGLLCQFDYAYFFNSGGDYSGTHEMIQTGFFADGQLSLGMYYSIK